MAEIERGRQRLMLITVFAAVTSLLLIACVNIANLLLARGSQRVREFGVRAALGAGRVRLVRQLLTEGLLLFAAGTAAGLAFAYVLTAALGRLAPMLLPPAEIEMAGPIRLDWHVLTFMIAFSGVVGLATSLLPALRISRSGIAGDMHSGGRGSTAGPASLRVQKVLVTAEVALSFLLLVVAALLTRSMIELQRVNPGVRVRNVLTAGVWLPETRYSTPRSVADFPRELLPKLAAVPGVRSAGAIDWLPLNGWWSDSTISIEGRPPAPPGQWIDPIYREASPTYFRTMGIPILRGRAFVPEDSPILPDKQQPAQRVAIISKQLAEQYWPHGDALGALVRFGDENSMRFRIVGIAGDVRHDLNRPPAGTIYIPMLDGLSQGFFVVLHTSIDPSALIPAVRRALREADPDLPPFDIRTMEEVSGKSAAQTSGAALLLGSFAVLALGLAGIGLYGVLSYANERRRNETGVRMALGATRSRVLSGVLASGMAPTIAGLVLGFAAAWTAVQTIRSLLYGVLPADGVTFTTVPLILIAVTLAASLVPAWRATRIDPMTALRCE
jgi:putative ABC transport system permease protein